jgi:hypothetical protein
MINTVSIKLTREDGSERTILIDPILERISGKDLIATDVYKLYKTTADNEAFFTEPLLMDKKAPEPDDIINPDYLGQMTFDHNNTEWKYTGDLLTPAEQKQAADYIKNYHRSVL